MAEHHEFDDSGIDIWTEQESFEVTRERIADYAAATNDPIEAHRSGDIASPVFSIVPVFETMIAPAFDVFPIAAIPRIVHGEQDFHYIRALRPGDKLLTRAKMTGYEGLDNGTAATTLLETRTVDGELVGTQYVTSFARGINAGKTIGTLAPAHRFDETLRAQPPVATVAQQVDQDQTFRYAGPSGDPNPIHLDDEVAKDLGLPGIINHGLCTMAFTSWAVLTTVAASDVRRLKRFAVRFAKPVLPGQPMETVIWRRSSENGETAYQFETTVNGEVVVKDGLAVIVDVAAIG
ncbi:MaoC/PaaZ C-terminal domain-containing protein [Nocardia sp. NPDC051030]|uniref:MaoC/PaaZ C-terminal domain-containing protein n=1 Tax=Nocardia sp. NPDC051030 TaxID=3155162 RepID=UPI00341F1ECC